jgi:hypothetical protein
MTTDVNEIQNTTHIKLRGTAMYGEEIWSAMSATGPTQMPTHAAVISPAATAVAIVFNDFIN